MHHSYSLAFPRKFLICQGLLVSTLFFLHLVSQSYGLWVNPSLDSVGTMQILNLDNEMNLPAWYSSCAIFLCSVLLFIIGHSEQVNKRRMWFQWTILSAVFAYLSLDEAVSLHEGFIPGFLKKVLNDSAISDTYDWTYLGILFFVVIAVTYFRFWCRLPEKVRWMFALACFTFLLGAIGFEKISHFYEAKYQTENTFSYILTCGIEEFLEMSGIALFTYALLTYIVNHTGFILISSIEKLEYLARETTEIYHSK